MSSIVRVSAVARPEGRVSRTPTTQTTNAPCGHSAAKAQSPRSRRSLLGLAAGMVGGASLVQGPWNGAAEAFEGRNPYEEGKRMEFGPLNGRVRGCPGSVNPNCVSTSSTNDSYSPAWTAVNETNAKAAASVLEETVPAIFAGAALANAQTLSDGEYRAFTVPGIFGKDVMEFIVRDSQLQRDNWEDTPGLTVVYRSMAGGVKYLWPLQQPISDGDAQKKRLKTLRDALGWRLIGCELIECYDF